MRTNVEPLAILDAGEAMRLLRTARVGRVVYSADALPAIERVPLLSGIWPMYGGERYIRISCDLITGRRLGEWGQQT